MIVIPDIHGRTFWKKAVAKAEELGDEIVFLGDYVDPYGYEGITKEEAIENFKEIIEYAKAHKDNVTLCIGNHDLGGYICAHMPKCRFDFINYQAIKSLFIDNIDLFTLGIIREIDGKKYTFSHSCILKGWLARHKIDFDGKLPETIEELFDILNKRFHDKDFLFIEKVLGDVSYNRGGWDDYGSMVWAHWTEVIGCDEDWPGYFQVFGHSQQEINPVIGDYYANLDCRKAFILDETNKFTPIV